MKKEREIQEKTRKLCEKYNFNPDLALKILNLLIDYNKEIQMKELKK